MNSGPKWSLRNGSQYQRLCARAGCGAPASVTLRFQPTERQAWLVALDEHAARTQGDLCNRHAEALVLPRGWALLDERTLTAPAPVADAPVEAPPAQNGNGNAARRARVRPKAQPGATPQPSQLPGLDGTADTRDDSEPNGRAPDAENTDAQSSPKDGDPVDEALSAILDARTPLLQRAFRNSRPL
jgi:hypothetical protein